MKLLLLFSFITTSLTSKAPICTSVIFSAQWSKCGGALLYAYDIQMNVTVDRNNQTFPNIVTLSKLSEYTANHAFYYADTPITYSYVRYWNDWYPSGEPFFLWNSTDSPYSFHYPNGYGRFDIGFVDGNLHSIFDAEYEDTFIHNGEIFMNFFPLPSPCLLYYRPDECRFWEIQSNQSICCNNFIYVDIPDDENEICELYQSTTTLKDSSQSIIAYLNASYIIGNNEINLNVTDFKSYNDSLESRYAIGTNLECTGNNASPYSKCSFYFWDDDSDTRYNFLLDYEWADQNQNVYGYYAIAAIFVRRNRIFLKDDNTLFTSSNPCWTVSTEIAYGNGTSFDTSLCCTNFVKPPSTPASTTPPTTKPPISCLEFTSTTFVSDNSARLLANYKLNSTGMEINITFYREQRNSSAQLEVYSLDSFSVPCKKTFGSPFKPCFYALSDNKNYELKLRTSIFKDGFNMLSIVAKNGKLILPVVPLDFPCYVETNPNNDVNSKLTATTSFCCNAFG